MHVANLHCVILGNKTCCRLHQPPKTLFPSPPAVVWLQISWISCWTCSLSGWAEPLASAGQQQQRRAQGKAV